MKNKTFLCKLLLTLSSLLLFIFCHCCYAELTLKEDPDKPGHWSLELKKKLALSKSDIDSTLLNQIIQYFQRNIIYRLIIENRRFKEGTLNELFLSLKQNLWLKVIKLSGTDINDEDTQLIVDALIDNESIEELYLQHNLISDAGALAIASFLQIIHHKNITHTQYPPIRVIDLTNNNIGDAGAIAIAEALLTTTDLQELYLTQNSNIGRTGSRALTLALRRNLTLVRIEAPFNSKEKQIVALIMRRNLLLRELQLQYGNTSISRERFYEILTNNNHELHGNFFRLPETIRLINDLHELENQIAPLLDSLPPTSSSSQTDAQLFNSTVTSIAPTNQSASRRTSISIITHNK